MVEPELALLEVKRERALVDAIELGQATLGKAPEALDAVDVIVAEREAVFAVSDAKVLGVTDGNQAIVGAQAVGMDDAAQAYLAANDRLQSGFRAVGHDLGIDLAVALEDTKDDGLAERTTAFLSAHATWPEVALVDFDRADKRRCAPALFGQTPAQLEKQRVDRAHAHAGQLRRPGRRQIEREATHNAAKPSLGQARTIAISVFACHCRSLACIPHAQLPKSLTNVDVC